MAGLPPDRPHSGRTVTCVQAPSIVGRPVVGHVLEAAPGEWNVGGLAYRFAWYVGGRLVAQDTKVWMPLAEHVGLTVRLEVRATRAGYATGHARSEPEGPVLDSLGTAPQVLVSGVFAVGGLLTAHLPEWEVAPCSYSFQWYTARAPITGATGRSLRLGTDLVGEFVLVMVTAHKPGYADAMSVSMPLGPLA